MRLTNQSVAKLKLPPGKSEQLVFDDALTGFGVRIRAGGKRTWIAQYRANEKQRRVTIGTVGIVMADQAREKAKTLLANVQLGSDPQADRLAERAKAAQTLGAVAEIYLERCKPRLSARHFAEVKRYFAQQWQPLSDVPVHQITRAAIASRLAKVHDESGPVAANRARTALSAFFSWAIREGIAETNPTTGTNRAHEASRERILTNDELVAVWNACDDDQYGRIVRLLILTAQRREEVGGICESELNRESAVWALPGKRTKNKLPHDVPLSDAALELLPEATEGRDFLFGRGRGGYSGWSRSKERLDERCGVKDWTHHDLRRTAATGMAELRIQPHIIEAVLNHVSGHKGGVAGIYNKAQYGGEKRQALDLWAAHIQGLVSGKASNVVTLARA